ncbi:MAG: hypothetical protein JSW10_13200 [Pseudomonadota bacterium]|nr:MAG: hypothetical protein JSW10_13200 [Pseudomonadota bacterium]
MGRLCVLLCALGIAGVAQAGSIKCWTNKEGVRECGYQVPNEHLEQRVETLNERGIVVEVEDASVSAEEKAARQKAQAAQAEQDRRDRLLLRVYTTERDLIIARDNRVAAINALIEVTNANTNGLLAKLEKLQEEAANYERKGKNAPQRLMDNMGKLGRSIENNNAFVANKQLELAEVERKYDADLKRFRELKSASR